MHTKSDVSDSDFDLSFSAAAMMPDWCDACWEIDFRDMHIIPPDRCILWLPTRCRTTCGAKRRQRGSKCIALIDFSQLTDWSHPEQFRRCVKRYDGNYKVYNFPCWDQFCEFIRWWG